LRSPKATVAFAHDAAVVAVFLGGALYLRLGESMFALGPDIVWSMLVVLLAIAGVTFPLMGMYRGL
jgi:hypothetical protein